MQTSNINKKNTDFTIALEFRKREVNATYIAKTEKKRSKDIAASQAAVQSGNPSIPPNTAPVVGNMFFQVCGGVQSTLAALQGVISENEAKLMETGTILAQANYTMQGTESESSYTSTVASGIQQAQNLKLSAIQSFTTAGITLASVGGQLVGENLSESSKNLDTLRTKLSDQEKLAALARPSAQEHLASLQVGNDPALATAAAADVTTAAAPAAAREEITAAVKARAQDLLASGGARTFTKFDESSFPQENVQEYNKAEGSYYVKELDESAIGQMEPKDKAAFYRSVEDQIKTTKQEINTAEMTMSNMRQMLQTASQLGTQVTTAAVATAQAPVAYAQKLAEASATMESQAFGTSSANSQLAAKMRETAADEAKNTLAAIMQAVVAVSGRA